MLYVMNEVTGEIYREFSLFERNVVSKASRFCLDLGLTMVAQTSDTCGNRYWFTEEQW